MEVVRTSVETQPGPSCANVLWDENFTVMDFLVLEVHLAYPVMYMNLLLIRVRIGAMKYKIFKD